MWLKFRNLHVFHFVWIVEVASFAFRLNFWSGVSFFALEFQKLHRFYSAWMSEIVSLLFCLRFRSSIAFILFEFQKFDVFDFVWMSDVASLPLCSMSQLASRWFCLNFRIRFPLSFCSNFSSSISFVLFQYLKLHLVYFVELQKLRHLHLVRLSQVASFWSCVNLRIRICFILLEFWKTHFLRFVWIWDVHPVSFCMYFRSGVCISLFESHM